METVYKVTAIIFMYLGGYSCGRLHEKSLSQESKQPEPFHICAMCETKIDTVNDKALRQWLYDTPARLRFKKMLILEDAKKK